MMLNRYISLRGKEMRRFFFIHSCPLDFECKFKTKSNRFVEREKTKKQLEIRTL